MRILKHIVSVATAFFLIWTSALCAPSVSDWARENIENAEKAGIIPHNAQLTSYNQPITRGEIANLIANAYTNVTKTENEYTSAPFLDASDNIYVALVYQKGIMNGRGDGVFDPESVTTRQEMAKIILSFSAVANGEVVNISKNANLNFTDADTISEWAVPYVTKAVSDGIIKGYDDGTFGATLPVTWEQAISLVTRCVKLNEIKKGYTIKWNGKTGVDTYTVKITENRLSHYEGDIPPNEAITYITDKNELTFYPNPNRKYNIEITGINYTETQEIIIPRVDVSDVQNKIREDYPTTKEEADALMVEVEVPVWKMSGNGEKYSSTAKLTVHNLIADSVKAVFEEIYEGDEKFPIKDLGAYAWRGGTTEHNSGTAIDINYNENYCLYKDGSSVGSHWKPYEDEYSITPYGDVIRAFEKYGFTWGGDAWSNPKDYMHFSYLGT